MLAAAHLGLAPSAVRGEKEPKDAALSVKQSWRPPVGIGRPFIKSMRPPPEWRNGGAKRLHCHIHSDRKIWTLSHNTKQTVSLIYSNVIKYVCRPLWMFTLPNWIRVIKVCKLVSLCWNPAASLLPPFTIRFKKEPHTQKKLALNNKYLLSHCRED